MLFTGGWILIAAAIIPAIVLLRFIYNQDKLDKESPRLLANLVVAGIISTVIALIGERIGSGVLSYFFEVDSLIYNILMYFVVVGISEEGGKYIVLKKRTWRNPEFNCQFDGVVYATFVSLGFALWENIEYVLMYGMQTAMIRAVTAVPGHCCFGVFMGVFYGLAKKNENYGHPMKSACLRKLAVIVPVIIHGAYDFIATMGSKTGIYLFVVFIAILFLFAFKLVKNMTNHDQYISVQDDYFPWIR